MVNDTEIQEQEEKQELPEHLVESPVDEGFPMVLLISSSKCFIGALHNIDEGEALILTPLVYVEIPKGDGMVDIGMARPFMTLKIPDEMFVRYDVMYLMKSKSDRDNKLVVHYNNMIKEFKAQEAGLITPSMENIAQVNKDKN